MTSLSRAELKLDGSTTGVCGGPSVQVVSAWFNLYDNEWSGVAAGLVNGLRDLGAYGGNLDASGWRPPVTVARKWLAATRRLDDWWLLTPEMMLLNRGMNGLRRLVSHEGTDGFVQLGCFYGMPVRGSIATFEDRTLTQLPPGHDSPPYSARKFRRMWRSQARLYRHATACCVASSWTKRSLVSDFGVPEEKVHVVGYGANIKVSDLRMRRWSGPRFLFVGKDWARKNGEATLRAFAHLRRERPDARLDVVGDHSTIDVAGATGHGSLNVNVADDRRRLAGLFANATAFVLPALEEPFGIAYIEAMAAGLPVIATSVGGPPDFIDDDIGVLVDPADEGAILRAMRILCHPERSKRMGRAGQAKSTHYTWPAVAGRVLTAMGLAR